MLRLLAGMLAVSLIVWVAGATVSQHEVRLLVNVVVVPVSLAWVILEAIHLFRPRRIFRGRRRCSARLVGLGVVAAILAHLLATIALAYLGPTVEMPAFAVAFGAVAAGIGLGLPRQRPDLCVYCYHDLRGQRTGTAACSECGHDRLLAA